MVGPIFKRSITLRPISSKPKPFMVCFSCSSNCLASSDTPSSYGLIVSSSSSGFGRPIGFTVAKSESSIRPDFFKSSYIDFAIVEVL